MTLTQTLPHGTLALLQQTCMMHQMPASTQPYSVQHSACCLQATLPIYDKGHIQLEKDERQSALTNAVSQNPLCGTTTAAASSCHTFCMHVTDEDMLHVQLPNLQPDNSHATLNRTAHVPLGICLA
jgi:hypothetical protein